MRHHAHFKRNIYMIPSAHSPDIRRAEPLPCPHPGRAGIDKVCIKSALILATMIGTRVALRVNILSPNGSIVPW